MWMGRKRTRRGALVVALFLVLPAAHAGAQAPSEAHAPVALAAFDSASGRWYLHPPGSAHPAERFFFGQTGDVGLMGDWDCDGVDTVGTFNPNTGLATLRNSNAAGPPDVSFYVGQPGDIPLAGDWDGDGCDSVGVYRPQQGRALLRNRLSTGTADLDYFFGDPGDRPFAADFTGAGYDTVGLYRETSGLVYLRQSHTTGFADFSFVYGNPQDRFVAGDWDGDGTDTVGVVRTADATFYARNANTQGIADYAHPFADSDLQVVSGRFPLTGPGDPAVGRILPTNRLVAYYGNHQVPAMGVLGETGPAEAVARVQAAAAPIATPQRPAVGAFEMIVTVAQARPGADGNYSAPSDPEQLRPWLAAAEAAGLQVIFDIQPGRSHFLPEVQRYEELLKEPHVHLALDPEWRVGPGGVPGQGVGQVDASEVNLVSAWLSNLVVEHNLPDKLLIIHQFELRMITNRDQLLARPGLIPVIHMDGFGPQWLKLQTYSYVHVDGPPWRNGFKLFYDEDTDIFEPWEVLQLDPVPDLITYQ